MTKSDCKSCRSDEEEPYLLRSQLGDSCIDLLDNESDCALSFFSRLNGLRQVKCQCRLYIGASRPRLRVPGSSDHRFR